MSEMTDSDSEGVGFIHVAIMERHGTKAILSFDRGFDAVPSLRRIGDGP